MNEGPGVRLASAGTKSGVNDLRPTPPAMAGQREPQTAAVEPRLNRRGAEPPTNNWRRAMTDQVAVAAVEAAPTASLQERIDFMFARDRVAAGILIAALWATVFFVMLAVRSYITQPEIEVVCWIAAAVLLMFNTGSIVAMFRHYAADKQHIYSVDIRHLDAGR